MTEEEEHEETAPGDSSLPPEQEDRIVDRVVEKVKGVVQSIAGSGGEDDDDGSGAPSPRQPSGPASTEADMEGKVKAAVEKEITSKERARERQSARAARDAEIDGRLKALEEKPPKTYSRLQTVMWGSDDQ